MGCSRGQGQQGPEAGPEYTGERPHEPALTWGCPTTETDPTVPQRAPCTQPYSPHRPLSNIWLTCSQKHHRPRDHTHPCWEPASLSQSYRVPCSLPPSWSRQRFKPCMTQAHGSLLCLPRARPESGVPEVLSLLSMPGEPSKSNSPTIHANPPP